MDEMRPDTGSESTSSRLGGAPYLAPEETWPSCCGCAEPLRFAMQLNYDESVGPERGLLQFFYCAEADCTASDGKLVRLVHPPRQLQTPPDDGLSISGWDITPAPEAPAQAAILAVVEAAEQAWAEEAAPPAEILEPLDPESELRMLMRVTAPTLGIASPLMAASGAEALLFDWNE